MAANKDRHIFRLVFMSFSSVVRKNGQRMGRQRSNFCQHGKYVALLLMCQHKCDLLIKRYSQSSHSSYAINHLHEMKESNPWKTLGPDGADLGVDDFLTTVVVRLGTVLKKAVTQSYVEGMGLTQAQWRILSVLAEAPSMQMTDLVSAAVVDKALVSRILRQLESQELVVLEGDPLAPRKGLLCKLSRKGRRLYDKAITEVRRRQAAMILELDPHEREVTYIALKKLYSACSNTKG